MKYKNGAFPFKAHNMYKTERAETEGEHNALGEKGFDHNPYKKMDAMYNGEPGIQKEDFAQFSPMKKRGLWDNIHAKRKRGETMRKKGDPGAPTEKAIRDSQ